jgi:hypothetical protein
MIFSYPDPTFQMVSDPTYMNFSSVFNISFMVPLYPHLVRGWGGGGGEGGGKVA